MGNNPEKGVFATDESHWENKGGVKTWMPK